jgi:NAD-dependent deacetylase
MIDPQLQERLRTVARGPGRVTVLTGAGISAESGIPTFRGPEGYWTVGSREYHPQEMATLAMFRQSPETVWAWYLHRAGVCRAAAPNPGHRAVARLEALLGARFTLITQNVDGLHLRAGNSPGRTFQIHGNILFMRCAAACTPRLRPLPEALTPRERHAPLAEREAHLLRCPDCGGWDRPYVLWFDECYDEAHFRFDSSLETAAATALLIVVGTSGSTNLPGQVAATVYRRGGTILDINPADNPFAALARHTPGGAALRGTGAAVLPALAALFEEASPAPGPPAEAS